MPKPAPRSFTRVLDEDPRLNSWKIRHEREQSLTEALRRRLPRPLGERIRVAEIRAGTLEVVTSAGAIAAAVRQRAPDLLAALQREGHDFTELRVRVQVGATTQSPPKVPSRQWDSGSASALFRLGDTLGPGPLKISLTRWSRRARGR